MDQKTILLASFLKKDEVPFTLKKIKENFAIVSSKVFVLKDKSDESKSILTYNISVNDKIDKVKFSDIIQGTISLHRKKDTNTLYTINSLNSLVKLQNNGIEDRNFKVSWEDYTNCILITKKDNSLLKIETELLEVIDLSTLN